MMSAQKPYKQENTAQHEAMEPDEVVPLPPKLEDFIPATEEALIAEPANPVLTSTQTSEERYPAIAAINPVLTAQPSAPLEIIPSIDPELLASAPPFEVDAVPTRPAYNPEIHTAPDQDGKNALWRALETPDINIQKIQQIVESFKAAHTASGFTMSPVMFTRLLGLAFQNKTHPKEVVEAILHLPGIEIYQGLCQELADKSRNHILGHL